MLNRFATSFAAVAAFTAAQAHADITISDFSNFEPSGAYEDWSFGTFTSGADDFRVESTNFGGAWLFMDAPIDGSAESCLEITLTANAANVTDTIHVVLFSNFGETEAGFTFTIAPGTQTLTADLMNPTFFNNGDISTWDPSDIWDQWHIQGSFANSDPLDITFDNLALTSGDCSSGGGLTLSITNACPGSGPATLTATGGSGGTVGFVYSNRTGSFTIPGGFTCAGTVLGLGGTPTLGGNASGDPAILNVPNAPSVACGSIFVQAIDTATCETSNVVAF